MGNAGKSTNKPGTSTLQVGLVVLLVGVVLAVLNALNEGQPPGWTIVLVVAGLIATIAGYAMRILAAVERR